MPTKKYCRRHSMVDQVRERTRKEAKRRGRNLTFVHFGRLELIVSHFGGTVTRNAKCMDSRGYDASLFSGTYHSVP